MTQRARQEQRADAATADALEWTPYVSRGGTLRTGHISCCGQYVLASESGQYFVLRPFEDGDYEETGRGRTHRDVVEIYAALVVEHHSDEHGWGGAAL
ncbi:hypothetical protein ABZW49_35540 [Nonomuraea wenchangensis]